MSNEKEDVMTNYKNIELGKLDEIINAENGKVFLHDALGLTSSEISVNCMPVGFKIPFNHKHFQNEEIYIFLKGEGIMTVDNSGIKVKEGSCVKVLPAASRTLENTGSEALQFICIQAKENSLEQFCLKDAELC